jgi:hypothetical protein
MVENVILLHFFHSVIVRRIYCECGLPWGPHISLLA